MPWTRRGKRDELLTNLQAALARKDSASTDGLLKTLVENHRGDRHITDPVIRAVNQRAEEDPAGAVVLIHDLLFLSPGKDITKTFITRSMTLSTALAEADLKNAVEAAWFVTICEQPWTIYPSNREADAARAATLVRQRRALFLQALFRPALR